MTCSCEGGTWRCGTERAWEKHGCRCEPCHTAIRGKWNKRNAKRRAHKLERRQAGLPPVRNQRGTPRLPLAPLFAAASNTTDYYLQAAPRPTTTSGMTRHRTGIARGLSLGLDPLASAERYPVYGPVEIDDDDTVTDLAERIGFERHAIYHWRDDGGIPLYSADRAAVALHLHPAAIWPDWFDLADVDIEAEAALAEREAAEVAA